MKRESKPLSLPPRLLRALWIWLALTPLVALLPRSSAEAVGLLAHPVFWCAMLPALVLLPYLKQFQCWTCPRSPAPGPPPGRAGSSACTCSAQTSGSGLMVSA